jgi:hypothetical protein
MLRADRNQRIPQLRVLITGLRLERRWASLGRRLRRSPRADCVRARQATDAVLDRVSRSRTPTVLDLFDAALALWRGSQSRVTQASSPHGHLKNGGLLRCRVASNAAAAVGERTGTRRDCSAVGTHRSRRLVGQHHSASGPVCRALHSAGYTVIDTDVNWLLIADAAGGGRAARRLVRDCRSFGLPDVVRVALRRPDQFDRVIAAFHQVRR